MRISRIAVITGGRSPRPELLAELSARLGPVRCDEFGALDDVSEDVLAHRAPDPEAPSFLAPLGGGANVVVSVALMEEQVARLVGRLDELGYDLVVIAATALFAPVSARTPVVHGQRAVDAWISALAVGDINIGLIYPLSRQGKQLATFAHRTQFQSANATIKGGHSAYLTQAASRVSRADLIVMQSVGYTEAMAEQVARESGKPVVTARGIIAAAMRLRLDEIMGRMSEPPADGYTGAELLKRLPEAKTLLTPRENEVLAHVLEGGANKPIARALHISHRTVEIHRSRAMAKLGARSVTELIRRSLKAPRAEPPT
ncbi:AroM family protein [Bradyrhizobium canariense]|uniref:AroM family protein n=1 Tax=Bradyrhizobium canariense TaxID=255045 RepID=UPI001FCE02A1|nr:AroM family protein [Bradyrhizobium canariense]